MQNIKTLRNAEVVRFKINPRRDEVGYRGLRVDASARVAKVLSAALRQECSDRRRKQCFCSRIRIKSGATAPHSTT